MTDHYSNPGAYFSNTIVTYIHVHNSTSYINNNKLYTRPIHFFLKKKKKKEKTTGFEIAQSRVCIICTIYHCNKLQWLQKSKFLQIFRWPRNWIKKQPAQQRTNPRSAWAISSPRGWQRISKFTSRMFLWYNLSWATFTVNPKQNDYVNHERDANNGNQVKINGEQHPASGRGENGTSSKMAGHFRFDLITQLRPGRKMETNWTFWNLVHVPWTQEQHFGPNIQRSTPYVASVKD